MRAAFLFLPLAALAACATPREQCIDAAMRDTRVLSTLIAETEANLARGYALETQQDVRSVRSRCQGRTETGEVFTFSCEETQTFNRTVPVAIDLNAEAAKLASLQERFAQQQQTSNAAVNSCIQSFPE